MWLKCEPKRDDWGVLVPVLVLERVNDAAVGGRVWTEILLRCRADARLEGRSRYAGVSGEMGGGVTDVGERRPGNEVKRGRM